MPPLSARPYARLSVFVLVALAVGCASPLSPPALRARLERAGSQVDGLSPSARIVPIHAGSQMEALTLLADARTEPRARMSLGLAKQIALGRSRRVHFVVGGPWTKLNRQVVANALAYHETTLPGLVVVLVSPQAPDEELTALARERRVQLLHRPFEPTLASAH